MARGADPGALIRPAAFSARSAAIKPASPTPSASEAPVALGASRGAGGLEPVVPSVDVPATMLVDVPGCGVCGAMLPVDPELTGVPVEFVVDTPPVAAIPVLRTALEPAPKTPATPVAAS